MNKTILIIEDNLQNIYLLSYLLRENEFSVLEATTGKMGLEMAIQHHPDVILLDVQLPEMDGFEIAKKLREIDALKKTPIIAVTSYAMVGDKEKIIEAGASGYIEKPIDPDTFLDKMEKILHSLGD